MIIPCSRPVVLDCLLIFGNSRGCTGPPRCKSDSNNKKKVQQQHGTQTLTFRFTHSPPLAPCGRLRRVFMIPTVATTRFYFLPERT